MDWAEFLKDLSVGLIVPIVGIALAVIWKSFARKGHTKPSDECLAVFELLMAAVALTISEVFGPKEPAANSSGAATPASASGTTTSGDSTLMIAFVAVLFLFPIMAVTAYAIREAGWDAKSVDPSNPELNQTVMWVADVVGLIAFAAVYVAFHVGG